MDKFKLDEAREELLKDFTNFQYNVVQLILINSALNNITVKDNQYQTIRKEEENIIFLLKNFEYHYLRNIDRVKKYQRRLNIFSIKPLKYSKHRPVWEPHLH